jgi:type VI protein secretion system component VasK
VRAVAVLVLPVLLTLSTISLVRNLQLARDGRALAESVRGVAPAGEQARDMAAALGELDPLRRQLVQLDRCRKVGR